ncbi:MAG: hypothetical protein WDO74_36375 [Pseudomonadota bacterium]
MKACELLAQHPELIVTPYASGVGAPERRGDEAAEMHPDAERLRDWKIMLVAKRLEETEAYAPALCADCGKAIEPEDPIVKIRDDEISTHRQCAGWWWTFSPPARNTSGYDDDPAF